MKVIPETSNRPDWPRLVSQASNRAQNDIKALQDGKQDKDATLTALAALDAAVGLLEQTGVDTFTKRALGVTAASSVPTRGDADGRYVMQHVGAAWGAPSGTLSRAAYAAYVAPTISVTPTQAEVQALANALQALSQVVVGILTDARANGVLS